MINSIKDTIKGELAEFESRFKKAMRSKVPLLDRISFYIIKTKGKQIRPLFVLLSAKTCGGITDSTYHAAAFIELLHTATLVHDDVVDNSEKRRGFFSITALWKHKVAVLVGDYLYAKGFLLALEHKEYDLLHIISNAVKKMSEGELLQMQKSRKLDIDEETYFEIIKQKTATLIASACSAGATSSTNDPEVIDKMHEFGEKIGIAFQIKDDLFDYGQKDIGKPLGIDIQEKKMTLPLIHSLSNADHKTRRRIINNIKRHSDKKEKVQEVIQFVHDHGGIAYAKSKMQAYYNDAHQLLRSLPQNDARDQLEKLIKFVIERQK